MDIGPGTRIGPYVIVSLLGSGGMGDVYQARDDRLGRFVAVKIIRRVLAPTDGTLERFQHEARASAALNHPNICTVYDVGTAPPFMAMELLEGETLSWRLTRGALDLAVLTETALGLTEALAYAHGKGIVHRDIKPANIFLTSRGPKLLDFGLAKLVVPSTAISDETRSIKTPVTGAGVTVGTVAYMSPEQLRGTDLDARTDLFSLGLVIYEMAAGRGAFGGETGAAIAGAILHERPIPPGRLRAGLPAKLDEIVLKCLEKDREDRYQTAADLRADLRRLKREHDSVSIPIPENSTNAGSGSVSERLAPSDSQIVVELARRHARGIAVGSIATLLVAVGGAFLLMGRPRSQSAAQIRSTDYEMTQLTTTGNAQRPAIAPAGNYIAYVQHVGSAYSLWVRQTATASSVQIVPAEKDVQLLGATVTPDGNYVDYVRTSPDASYAELWRVPFLGGTPKRVNDNAASLVGWSPDGTHMAFIRLEMPSGATSLIVADATGSDERVVATRKPPLGFAHLLIYGNPDGRPSWSSDGRSIAAVVFDVSPNTKAGASITSYDVFNGSSHATHIPGSGFGGFAWLDGTSFIVSSSTRGASAGQLFRVTYADHETTRLTNDLSVYDGISTTADRATLITARTETRVGIWVGDGNATSGRDLVAPAPIDGTFGFGLSWSGERIVYTGALGRLMRSSDTSTPEEVAPTAQWPSGGPHTATLFYSADSKLWRTDGDGRPPSAVGPFAIEPTMTHDGRFLVFEAMTDGTVQSPWIMEVRVGSRARISQRFAGGIDASPDGKSIVFGSADGPQPVVVMCDLPTCTNERIISRTIVSNRLRFTRDGRHVAFLDVPQTNLWLLPLDGGPAQQLTHFSDDRTILDFAWSWDWNRLAIARSTATSDIVMLTGLNPLRQSARPR